MESSNQVTDQAKITLDQVLDLEDVAPVYYIDEQDLSALEDVWNQLDVDNPIPVDEQQAPFAQNEETVEAQGIMALAECNFLPVNETVEHVQINTDHRIQLSETPLTGNFEVCLFRKEKDYVPVDYKDDLGTCPFEIVSNDEAATMSRVIQLGNSKHNGLLVALFDQTDLVVRFKIVSSKRTNQEEKAGLTWQEAKHLTLMVRPLGDYQQSWRGHFQVFKQKRLPKKPAQAAIQPLLPVPALENDTEKQAALEYLKRTLDEAYPMLTAKKLKAMAELISP